MNCFHHEGLGTSPFEALYGREPPPLIAAPPSASTQPDVAELIRQRGETIVLLRKNLERAQQRMQKAANKHRRELEFVVGDKVLLKLQQYRQHSVAKPLSSKLSRRFYGPFEVLERIGQVAYRLRLPEGSRVHNVFHVSLIKPFVEHPGWAETELPARFSRGRPVVQPTKILSRRTVWRDGQAVDEVQLEWSDDSGESPTWEPAEMVSRRFPALLEDKELSKGGGVVTGSPSAQLKERDLQLEEELDADTTVHAEEQRPEPARRDRSVRRQSKRPSRYADFVFR